MRKLGVEYIYKSQGSELTYNQITQLELESRSYSQPTLTYITLCCLPRKVTTKEKLLFWMSNTLQLFEMQNLSNHFSDFFLLVVLRSSSLVYSHIGRGSFMPSPEHYYTGLMMINQNKNKGKKKLCVYELYSKKLPNYFLK